jgi:undecaprenyl-diphosphatase
MEVWVAVVVVGLIAGLAAGLVQARSSGPDLDDPHVRHRTIRLTVAEHPLVRRVARAIPQRADVALAEAIALAAVVLVAVAAVTGMVLVMIRTDVGFARADSPIARWAADHASEGSTAIMRELTKFGGTAYVVIAAIAVSFYGWWRDRRAAVVLFVAATMIGQFAVSNSIKWSVDRARPSLSNLTGYAGTSFPSGHAVAAAAAWACVAFLVGRGRSRSTRALLVGAAVAIAVTVAGTRVALGVHWSTDVVIGLVIGWSWFAVCALLFDGRRLRTAEPLEVARERAVPDSRRGQLS